MADYRAISAVSEAVMGLLRTSYRPEDFNNDLEFRVFTSKDFTNSTIANGASLFMYRLYCNGAFRIPPGRIGPDGKREDTQLPLEAHFLITVWGGEASLQNTLAGWIMRTIEDNPVLPAAVLNSAVPDVFRPDETVDITHAELSTEDLFRIWEVLGVNAYQLSIPYVARVINVESTRVRDEEYDQRVQEKVLEAAER